MRKVEIAINDLLHKHQLTIHALHLKTGIRRATLSEMASGKRERIQLEHIEKIADALDIDDMNEILRFK
ncbi:helix-turn-helix transcriptional regulator [Shouchella clausii]|jgi:DNA-binding Xre family transcriptional regulator|uniref:helix-turn-helix domain-containing protein n=1 Tax=Shouchella TaxID=2893057 RepID=UPI0004E6B034|nr:MULTISPECIES: helix-turn-helix transcriptional regulator [Shouchella]ALA53533.1 transcriptional regulator, Cro/CI family [Shouchella clausii]MBU3229884.1 helix-turn-helix transcriptional regulator [Shouchella clausii]MBU3264032.1 helix-turn-helix transcriptional regulator [Shouchella clausii]MBU3506785.1 helix-turn-helix transcriptional regulator [Shouchella clausii]MBU3535150.1 helix-turn-helix transcriptional regulator [Shouchella clausii]